MLRVTAEAVKVGAGALRNLKSLEGAKHTVINNEKTH